MRKMRGFIEEQVLHDHALHGSERLGYVIRVGI